MKAVAAVVRLLSYRNKMKLFLWAVTDVRRFSCAPLGGFVSFSGNPERLWGSPSFCSRGIWVLFPSVNRPGREADH